jgi:hypothetical protein
MLVPQKNHTFDEALACSRKERLDNMSTKGYIPTCLSEESLRALVLDALENSPDSSNGTFHARFDHLERNLSQDDVIYGLERQWNFDRPPVFNDDEWQWKYYIATESIDGDDLLIIIAVDTLDHSFEVITRWRK